MPPLHHVQTFEGHLLIATPGLEDPNFWRSVVFVVQHDASGCVGLVLNRITSEQVKDHLPEWDEFVDDPRLVHYGGPVDPAVAIGLGSTSTGEPTGVEGLTIVDLAGSATAHSGRMRIYSGYSGWDSNQLEEEVMTGAWYVAPATAEDPFRSTETMWKDVLRRQSGKLSVVSTYTDEAHWN